MQAEKAFFLIFVKNYFADNFTIQEFDVIGYPLIQLYVQFNVIVDRNLSVTYCY